MKKTMMLMMIALIFSLTACKFTEVTGIGDGKVTLVESVMINEAVKAGLAVVPLPAQKAIHLVAGGMLEKLSTNDAITVAALDKAVPESVEESGITDQALIDEVNAFAGRVKNAIKERLHIDNDEAAQRYIVGIRAVLQAIYNHTA